MDLRAGTAGTKPVDLARQGLRAKAGRGFWREGWRRLRGDWLAMVSLVILCALVVVALAAPLISAHVTGYGPDDQNLLRNYLPPSPQHWFGTDEYGRDYLTRAVWASRISLSMGLAVAVVSLTIGVALGLIAGYYGGLIDDTINAVINTFISLPGLYVLFLLGTLIEPTVLSLAIIIGALGWMGTARQVRGVVLSVRQRDYVLAARVLGAPNRRIMVRHVLPNVASIVVVIAGFEVAGGIIAESALSFLSLGIRPPLASWGNMLMNSLQYVYRAPWLIVFPGVFIFVTVLCIFLFADGVRDALDPRIKDR